jgi:hypothetical protein
LTTGFCVVAGLGVVVVVGFCVTGLGVVVVVVVGFWVVVVGAFKKCFDSGKRSNFM